MLLDGFPQAVTAPPLAAAARARLLRENLHNLLLLLRADTPNSTNTQQYNSDSDQVISHDGDNKTNTTVTPAKAAVPANTEVPANTVTPANTAALPANTATPANTALLDNTAAVPANTAVPSSGCGLAKWAAVCRELPSWQTRAWHHLALF